MVNYYSPADRADLAAKNKIYVRSMPIRRSNIENPLCF